MGLKANSGFFKGTNGNPIKADPNFVINSNKISYPDNSAGKADPENKYSISISRSPGEIVVELGRIIKRDDLEGVPAANTHYDENIEYKLIIDRCGLLDEDDYRLLSDLSKIDVERIKELAASTPFVLYIGKISEIRRIIESIKKMDLSFHIEQKLGN